MKPEEQRIKIAEACGWSGCYSTDAYVTGIDPLGIERDLPDFCSDLNAMHEAEKTLEDKKVLYARHLESMMWDAKAECYTCLFGIFTATASQRAEAFLRTLNLWTDD